MPLKAVLATRADVEALPEAQRALYKESNGRYVLDVEGAVLDDEHEALNAKLAEFRDKNIQLMKAAERFKDVDPEEFRRLKTEVVTLREKGGQPDATALQQAIDKAIEPIRQQLDQAKADAKAKADALEKKELGDALWQVGIRAGVREEGRDFWLAEAQKVFRRDEKTGALVGFSGDAQLFSRRRGKASEPLTAEEWALEVAPQQPHLALLYKDSTGAGAKPGQQTTASGARILGRENAEAISNSLEAIAKGTVVVQ